MQESAQIPASGTAELVTRARSGDGSAYRELLARLAPAVRAYARRRLAQREAVEDFTQDALLAFVEAVQANRIDDPTRAASFALGICHNLARERAKVRDRRQNAWERFADFEGVTEAHEPALLERARLEDCLSLLTGKAQRVLRGSFFEEASDAEIAETMALSAANVRVIRHRSISALRQCVESSAKVTWEAGR
jgi:RNA polymerase sigma-70 factor (ECF subfamily)